MCCSMGKKEKTLNRPSKKKKVETQFKNLFKQIILNKIHFINQIRDSKASGGKQGLHGLKSEIH